MKWKINLKNLVKWKINLKEKKVGNMKEMATEKRYSKGKIKGAKTIFETIGEFFSIKGLLTQILETQSVSNWIKP